MSEVRVGHIGHTRSSPPHSGRSRPTYDLFRKATHARSCVHRYAKLHPNQMTNCRASCVWDVLGKVATNTSMTLPSTA
eukprot:5629382-Prymnesium_polylepis.1